MSTRRERANKPIRQLNKQLATTEEAVISRQERSRKNLHTAEIYIDVAKLVLGGMVFGNLFADKKYTYYIIAAGLLIFIILLCIGNYYFNKGNKDI